MYLRCAMLLAIMLVTGCGKELDSKLESLIHVKTEVDLPLQTIKANAPPDSRHQYLDGLTIKVPDCWVVQSYSEKPSLRNYNITQQSEESGRTAFTRLSIAFHTERMLPPPSDELLAEFALHMENAASFLSSFSNDLEFLMTVFDTVPRKARRARGERRNELSALLWYKLTSGGPLPVHHLDGNLPVLLAVNNVRQFAYAYIFDKDGNASATIIAKYEDISPDDALQLLADIVSEASLDSRIRAQ